MAKAEARQDKSDDARDADADPVFRPVLVKEKDAAKAEGKTGPWRSYKEVLAKLAQRLIDAQRPMRILNALRWPNRVEAEFLRNKARELPAPEYELDLGFDPDAKERELVDILKDIDKELGDKDPLARILKESAEEYRLCVHLLGARGTKRFYELSRKLYGSAKDTLPDGRTTVRDMGLSLYEQLTSIAWEKLGEMQKRDVDAATAAAELNRRFSAFFGEAAGVRVEVDDGLVADAAAGSDYVKIRTGATFSSSDIDILEAHEGWVHLATSLNGQAQPVARWLAKGPPRTTAVQEGLAALVEILTFRSTPRRAKKLNDRILAVDKAEDGASFIDVFEWFRTEGYDEEECFHNTRRIFRGGVASGGAPFTKDACYCKGIVLNYAFIRSAIQHNRVDLIPFLFVGKVAHEDVPVLARRVNDGVVKPPHFLPPMFRDLNGLAIWMAYSTFFTKLGGDEISEYYAKLFARAG
jgi:uncharacterized protein (TIGR02421 family)